MELIAWVSALFLSSAQKQHTSATMVGESPSGQCFPGSVLKIPELWPENLAGGDDGFSASPSAPRFPQPPRYPTACTALSVPICPSLFPSIESDYFIIWTFLNSSLPCFASQEGRKPACWCLWSGSRGHNGCVFREGGVSSNRELVIPPPIL